MLDTELFGLAVLIGKSLFPNFFPCYFFFFFLKTEKPHEMWCNIVSFSEVYCCCWSCCCCRNVAVLSNQKISARVQHTRFSSFRTAATTLPNGPGRVKWLQTTDRWSSCFRSFRRLESDFLLMVLLLLLCCF